MGLARDPGQGPGPGTRARDLGQGPEPGPRAKSKKVCMICRRCWFRFDRFKVSWPPSSAWPGGIRNGRKNRQLFNEKGLYENHTPERRGEGWWSELHAGPEIFCLKAPI